MNSRSFAQWFAYIGSQWLAATIETLIHGKNNGMLIGDNEESSFSNLSETQLEVEQSGSCKHSVPLQCKQVWEMNTFVSWLNSINHWSGLAAAAAAAADTDNCWGPRGVCGVRVINTPWCHRWPLQSLISCHREALPTDDRQTGSVWLGYAEQTPAATWWLDTAYICSLHQHHWGPRALGVWLSFLAPSPTSFFFSISLLPLNL